MAESKPLEPAHFFAKVLADQHYQKGREAEQQGDWEYALSSYRRACSVDAHNLLFLLARGHLCQAQGLDAEADECYRLALRLRPDDTVVLYNQAQLFAARGQLDAARANLAKIVAGDIDLLGERAAPVFCRLGDIALRDEEYTPAGIYFRRALECAPGYRYAAAALGGLERFAEFERPFEVNGQVLPKIAFYGYAGALLLGLPEDDGIEIPVYPSLGFDSLEEVAQTLARFVGLAHHFDWQLESVTALDPEGQPLAAALAVALDARYVPAIEQVGWGSRALAVSATAGNSAALIEGVTALRERAPRSLCYAVGVSQPIWEYASYVQVASLPVRLEFPWNRGEAGAAEHAEAYGAELAALLRKIGPANSTPAQAAWYATHARVSFDVKTLAPVHHMVDVPRRDSVKPAV